MSLPASPAGSGGPTQVAGSGAGGGANLADILERVLDQGIVIAGDIQINLLDIELLTIKLRLLVVSVDKAKEMGIDWWENDPSLSSEPVRDELAEENAQLRERLASLERSSADQRLPEAPRAERARAEEPRRKPSAGAPRKREHRDQERR